MDQNGTFTLLAGTITENTRGVYVNKNAVFNMKGGAIKRNTGSPLGYGTGVYVATTGSFVLENGTISNNSGSDYGGGVYCEGTLSVSGGEICENNAKRAGHGVCILRGSFLMSGGSIHHNSGKNTYGAGVALRNGASFTMEGGEICNNDHSDASYGGGGVAIRDNGSRFTMSGGSIHDNSTLNFGGGVWAENNNCVISGGSIYNNSAAKRGGAIYITGPLTISGGTITGNRTGGNGGGVFKSENRFAMSGDALIYGNIASGLGNDLYFVNSPTVAALRAPADYGMEEYDCWRNDQTELYFPATDYDELCQSLGWPQQGSAYVASEVGLSAAKYAERRSVAYRIPDGESNSENYLYYETLFEAMQASAADSDTVFLMEDFAESVTVPEGRFLVDLNGHVLRNGGTGAIFTLSDGADLSVIDTEGNYAHGSGRGRLTRNDDGKAACAFAVNSGNSAVLSLNDVLLTGFFADQGGVIRNAGTLSVTGGEFAENSATKGGVVFNTGTLTLSNCEFHDNTATDGAVVFAQGNTISMADCTAYDNSAGNGGVIYSNTSQILTILRGVYHDNTAKTNGGVYNGYNRSVLEVRNASVYCNSAGNIGGAFFGYSGTTQRYYECEIRENTAAKNGGAFGEMSSTTLVITDSDIHHNSSREGGAIYLGDSDSLQFSGGELHDNRSDTCGGAISAAVRASAVFTDGARVYSNTAETTGGAMHFNHNSVGVTLEDTLIYNNSSKSWGGAIQTGAGSSTTVYVKDGAEIYENYSPVNGGAVYGTVVMTGGSFYNNRSGTYGGAICGGVTMTGGEIHDNQAEAQGGGIYSANPVRIEAGKIYQNSAGSQGGAIGIGNGKLVISGGEIFGNSAKENGGALYVDSWRNAYCYATITGGFIHDNTAGSNGGGINYTNSDIPGDDHRLSVYGDAIITNNTAGSNGGGICFSLTHSSVDPKIVMFYIGATKSNTEADGDGAIYGNRAALGQDLYVPAGANPDIVRAAAMELPADYEVSGWLDESNGQIITTEIHGLTARYWALTLDYEEPDIVCYVGDQSFSTVQKAITYIQSSEQGRSTITMVDDSRGNVNLPAGLEVVLNLNGHGIRGLSTAFSVQGTLEIRDERDTSYDERPELEGSGKGAGPSGSGTLSGSAPSGGGISISNGGRVTLKSGTLTDCAAVSSGGAVYVGGGSFSMEGGAIESSFCTNGAAVYVNGSNSSFQMSGGRIGGNKGGSKTGSGTGQGVIYNKGGSIAISGGTLSGNTAGSVVYNESGSLNITGGVLENNKVTTGVIRVKAGTATVNGTEASPVGIRDNTAGDATGDNTGLGGGLYVEGGTVFLGHVSITGNAAKQNSKNNTGLGGGIYQSGGDLILSSGTVISGNSADKRGGGVYQEAGTFNMLSGTITANTAAFGGGVAQTPNRSGPGTINIYDGPKVYANRSTSSSTGNDIYSAYTATNKPWSSVPSAQKAKITLEAAGQMGLKRYNVWRDDSYDGTNYTDVPNLGDGLYLTGDLLQSGNLQLTAYYYNAETAIAPLDSNRYVAELRMNPTGYKSGSYANGENLSTAEKTASEMGWTESAETYVDQNGTERQYLVHPESGELYERTQMAEWTPGEDGSTGNSLILTNDDAAYSLSYVLRQPGFDVEAYNALTP